MDFALPWEECAVREGQLSQGHQESEGRAAEMPAVLQASGSSRAGSWHGALA